VNALHPGKSLPDYETQWSPGEHILARVVHTIGLPRFHRIPKSKSNTSTSVDTLEAHLKGKLIDVKNTDFDLNNNQNNKTGIQIQMEMKWIAKNIRNKFRLCLRNYETDAIVKAVIMYPVELVLESSIHINSASGGGGDGRDDTSVNVNVNVNTVLDMIQHIFEEEWSSQEKTVAGPLAGVEIIMQAI